MSGLRRASLVSHNRESDKALIELSCTGDETQKQIFYAMQLIVHCSRTCAIDFWGPLESWTTKLQ